jgi:fumarate hydratase class II
MSQELGAWASQLAQTRHRLQDTRGRLLALAQGGTAVGTGLNAPAGFVPAFLAGLQRRTGVAFRAAENPFAALSGQETALELSGNLKVLAVVLMKIANDLRWMNSGPLAGLGEITLPALQPGSSIMPGKVNPVIPEAVAQVAVQVMGYDAALTVAAQSGNFQLNVMLPLIANNLLTALTLLGRACRSLGERAIDGLVVNVDHLRERLERNPILVTALNALIGYEAGARIAKAALQRGVSVREAAREMTDLTDADLDRLLDPIALTRGGVPEAASYQADREPKS